MKLRGDGAKAEHRSNSSRSNAEFRHLVAGSGCIHCSGSLSFCRAEKQKPADFNRADRAAARQPRHFVDVRALSMSPGRCDAQLVGQARRWAAQRVPRALTCEEIRLRLRGGGLKGPRPPCCRRKRFCSLMSLGERDAGRSAALRSSAPKPPGESDEPRGAKNRLPIAQWLKLR